MLKILFYEVNPVELARFILDSFDASALKEHTLLASSKNIDQIRSAGLECKLYSAEDKFDVFVTSTSDNEYSVYPTTEDMAVYERVLLNEQVSIVPPHELFDFLFAEDGVDEQLQTERNYFEACVLQARQNGIL